MRCASAPGKVILFGEHFVVYGVPALVVSLGLRARVYAEEGEGGVEMIGEHSEPVVSAARYVAERLGYGGGMRLRVVSGIPRAVGLGSSAAVSVASAAAASLLIRGELLGDLVLEAGQVGEKTVHYTPSGIDTAIAFGGGGGVYRRGEGLRQERFRLGSLIVIDTGVERRTGEMVERVRRFGEREPGRFRRVMEEAAALVGEARDALNSGDLEAVGRLMNRNQDLLRVIGVSSPVIEDAITHALRSGALGAKLTGGGGGGCVIAVAEEGKIDEVAGRLAGRFRVMVPRLMVEGVREEAC